VGSSLQHSYGEGSDKSLALIELTKEIGFDNIEEIYLEIKRKKIMYANVNELEELSNKIKDLEDNNIEYKIVLSGEESDFKAIKNSSLYKETKLLENVKDEGIGFDYSQILVPLPDGGVEIGVTGPINKGTPSTTKVPDDLKPIGNGEITEDKLKTISTQPKYKLYTAAADAFVQMETDAKKAGFTLPLTSAYRTLTDQERVYKEYNGVGVAPVGTSPHGWGIAIDISPSHFGGVKRTTSSRVNEVQRQTKLYKWLETNAAKYNFYNPPALQDGQGYDEWWHWEWWG
jgi:D-alanyl-D-alanine carboxypeptidase